MLESLILKASGHEPGRTYGRTEQVARRPRLIQQDFSEERRGEERRGVGGVRGRGEGQGEQEEGEEEDEEEEEEAKEEEEAEEEEVVFLVRRC